MYLSSGKIQNHKKILMSKTKAVRMDYSLFSKENKHGHIYRMKKEQIIN